MAYFAVIQNKLISPGNVVIIYKKKIFIYARADLDAYTN